MLDWSVSLLSKFMSNPPLQGAVIAISSLNMLIQVLFSMMFGSKTIPKIGGKR